MELTELKVTRVHVEREEEVEQYFKCYLWFFLCMCASRERRVLKN